MNKKILLTGFKPFLSEPINPSELLVQSLAQAHPDIETLILPVSYERSFKELKNYWLTKGPFEGLLMLGQAGGRPMISLERVALNWSENSLADEDGVRLPSGPLVPEAPVSYISSFFPTEWRERLNSLSPTAISFSAGTYVCNSLYFRAIHELTQEKKPALFVHVPYLPEQTVNKPEAPSLSFESQLRAVSAVLNLMQGL